MKMPDIKFNKKSIVLFWNWSISDGDCKARRSELNAIM
jgi:hypothetical protein